MKDWKELTTEELANLTDEEISKYDKLICAKEGIPFMDMPEKPELTNLKEDLTIYKIEGIDNIAFTDVEEVNAVIEVLNKCKSLGITYYNYKCKYFMQGFKYYDGKPRNITLQSEMIFSEQTAIDNYEKQQENNKLENDYKDKLATFNDIEEKRLKAVNDFYNSVYGARDIMANRIKLANVFYKEYLPLTDGNKTMAMNFLKKAYTVSEEDEKFIEGLKVENK